MNDDGLHGIEGLRAQRVRCIAASFASAIAICAQCLALSFAVTSLWRGSSLEEVAPFLILFFGCFITRLGIAALEDFLCHRFAERLSIRLEKEYLACLGEAGPALVQRFGQAASILCATADVAKVKDYVSEVIPKQVAMVVIPLVLCIAIMGLDAISGVIVLICFPFIVIFMRLVGHTASDDAARRHGGFAQMSDHFMDALRGLSTLRLFNRAKGYGHAVFVASEEYRRQVVRTLRTATLSSTVLDLFATGGLAAVAIMLGFRMVEGQITFFPALSVLLLVPEFFIPIRRFAKGFHASLEGKAALGHVRNAVEFAREGESLSIEFETIENESALLRSLRHPGCPRIAFKDVDFSYGRQGHTLRHVSFDLGDARLVVVTGPSGAGKSTLLDIIAGFRSPSSGCIAINGEDAQTLKRPEWHEKVIYIPQRPYIFNATLKENVTLMNPQATDGCVERALDQVGLGYLLKQESGLDMMVGEGARPLSGGEAHRVALARALVAPDRSVVVLDEPTAHLDVLTEHDLQRTLREAFRGKLVILATHRMQWRGLADVNLVVEDGTVSVLPAVNDPACFDEDTRWLLDRMLAHGRNGSHASSTKVSTGAIPVPSPPDGHPEGSSATSRGIPQLLRALMHEHRGKAILSILLSVIAALFASALMFTSGYMISLAAAIPLTVLALHLPSLLVRVFGVGKPLIDYVERLMSHDWVLRSTSLMRKRLFEAIEHSAASRRTFKLGDALATLSEDIASAQDLFLRCAFPLITSMLLVVIVSILAVFASPLLGGVLFILFLMATICLGIAGMVKDGAREERLAKLVDGLYAQLTDHVMGIRDVILSGRGCFFAERVAQAQEQVARQERVLEAHQRLRTFACQALMGLAVVVCLVWVAMVFAPTPPAFPLPQWLLEGPLANLLSVTAPLNEVPWPPNWIAAFAICLFPLIEFFLPATNGFLKGRIAYQGVERLSSLIGSDANGCDSPSPAAFPMPKDDHHAVEAEKLAVFFPDCASPVIQDMDLSIRKGSMTAIMGLSGAGKTTLAKVMAGMIPPSSGTIRIQGSVGLIEQDAYVFHKTLRENLLIANGRATDGQLQSILEQVGLASLLERLPEGLDSVLAADGQDVSGGEACRITVARALLAGFDIVIFDEPFRALDPETEQSVLDTIQETLHDRTVIIVTHHTQDIKRFDDVIFVTRDDPFPENGLGQDREGRGSSTL